MLVPLSKSMFAPLAGVFGLHVILATVVVLLTFAAGSRGIGPGIVAGTLLGSAVIAGDLTLGQQMIAATFPQIKYLTLAAAAGTLTGIVFTVLVFEPADVGNDTTNNRSSSTRR